MNWRLPASAFEKGKGDGNKMALKERVDKGDFVGILAIDGVKAVAWCSVAPRATFPRLEKSKILKPVDDELVWSITCLYLDKSMRGRGFASEMIQAATQEACVRGAKIVEAYPFENTAEKLPPPFVWTGLSSSYYKAGFTEVARRSASRPVLRFTMK